MNDPTYRTIADVVRTCRLLVTHAEAIKTLAEHIEHAATIPDLTDEIHNTFEHAADGTPWEHAVQTQRTPDITLPTDSDQYLATLPVAHDSAIGMLETVE